MANNPFQPQATTSQAQIPGTGRSPSWYFRPLATLALIITIAIVLHLVGTVGIQICDTISLMALQPNNNPNAPLSSTETMIALTTIVFALLLLVGFLVAIVATCMFMYRANVNVRAMGATGLDNSPGWCGGYWFIPFVNLVMPYRCMNEINMASRSPKGISWKSLNSESLLSVWWGCWIIGNILSNVETRLTLAGAIQDPAMIALFGWITTLLSIAAGITFVMIVRRIANLQSHPRGTEQSTRYGADLYAETPKFQ